MSEPNVPPPPSYTPPPPPTGTTPPPGTASPNRGLMTALAYLPFPANVLAVVPLVVEKNDPEVQWHAKHGLVILIAEVILFALIGIIVHVIPFAGCVLWMAWPLLLILHIILIVKAVNGQRILIPGISEYANRF